MLSKQHIISSYRTVMLSVYYTNIVKKKTQHFKSTNVSSNHTLLIVLRKLYIQYHLLIQPSSSVTDCVVFLAVVDDFVVDVEGCFSSVVVVVVVFF